MAPFVAWMAVAPEECLINVKKNIQNASNCEKNERKVNQITELFRIFAEIYMHKRMYFPNTKPLALQVNYNNKQCNTLNINDLGGGVLRDL